MITDLHNFLEQYFTSHECVVVTENGTEMTIHLTRELDQVLMNRPFYWHYMDKTGRQGEPMSIQLDTSTAKPENNKEWIHFGSPRLQQIFNHIKQKARYTMLYEETNIQVQTALLPWLIANVAVHYIGSQKKQEVYSIGLHLLNGSITTNMMEHIDSFVLQRTMSDYSYTISPIIKPISGFNRIFQFIEQQLLDANIQWARESKDLLQEELQLVHYFFDKQEENRDILEKENERLHERLEPKIEINLINAGLFYLTESSTQFILKK
ncbi:conserved protein YqhG [Gracilibacillus boraciitolerans JCM 21714]|uniref:Conserved protein YqhG n=1 Tax=Gracilibacillus boraciitolerans JCM 21714 TaxID=1298598 RepID=W4VEI4_9BACI|nr:YqhG family protein [Gracilibacillus boraciitolerans]GAE91223.1 conserved protein YqhG [Gracilibacillus boraciitolerans JCM 21714]